MRVRAVVALVLAGVGCGGKGSGPTLPQVVNGGGPMLQSPVVVPVIWQGDPNATSMQQYLQYLMAADRFPAVLGQYGVTSIALAPTNLISGPLPTSVTDDDLRGMLQQEVNDILSDGGSSASLSELLTVFVIPQATTETFFSGQVTLCNALAGYHSFLKLADGPPVAYAVAGTCEVAESGVSSFDVATLDTGHEIAEAATDPQLLDVDSNDDAASSPAWSTTNDPSWPILLGGGEVGDLCAFAHFRDDAGFLEQFYWSNALASAGHDPCGRPQFIAAAPPAGSLVSLSGVVSAVGEALPSAMGLSIGAGQSATVPIELISDGTTSAPWTVEALDSSAVFGGSPGLTLSLTPMQGIRGSQLSLAVTVSNPPSELDENTGLGGFLLVSLDADGGVGSFWPVLVQSK